MIILNCSCNKITDNIDSDKLEGTWIFKKFIDKTTNESFYLPDDSAEVTFHGGNCIYVIGPCNRGNGKYEIDDNKILIMNLAMTERVCTNIFYEKMYTENLSGIYEIKGDTLTIISDFDTDLVLFRADSTKIYHCYNF